MIDFKFTFVLIGRISLVYAFSLIIDWKSVHLFLVLLMVYKLIKMIEPKVKSMVDLHLVHSTTYFVDLWQLGFFLSVLQVIKIKSSQVGERESERERLRLLSKRTMIHCLIEKPCPKDTHWILAATTKV